jgi:hypothetical protein
MAGTTCCGIDYVDFCNTQFKNISILGLGYTYRTSALLVVMSFILEMILVSLAS